MGTLQTIIDKVRRYGRLPHIVASQDYQIYKPILELIFPSEAGGGGSGGIPFANVKSLLHFDGNLTDQKGITWTSSGSAIPSGTPRFGSNSLSVSGAGRITTTNSAVRPTTAQYEFWVNSTNAVDDYYISSEGPSWSWDAGSGIEFFVSTDKANQRLALAFNVGGSPSVVMTPNGSFVNNTDYFVTIRIDPAATNKIELYLGTTLVASSTTAVHRVTTWSSLSLGSAVGTGDGGSCLIDEFRCSDITFAVTVPTAAFPDS